VASRDPIGRIEQWLAEEGLEVRRTEDGRAEAHLHVRYPPTKHGHVFNIVIPKGRSLVIIGSMTRVDSGQQEEMEQHAADDSEVWEEWLHDTRIHLTREKLDWVLHVGHNEEQSSGPLQAFNISRPIWFEGLNQHTFMDTMRAVWLAKLAIIHEIKFSFGPGVGKPGEVDDWKQKAVAGEDAAEVDVSEDMSFGSSFDPNEYV
jgi:hypothetical protein